MWTDQQKKAKRSSNVKNVTCNGDKTACQLDVLVSMMGIITMKKMIKISMLLTRWKQWSNKTEDNCCLILSLICLRSLYALLPMLCLNQNLIFNVENACFCDFNDVQHVIVCE